MRRIISILVFMVGIGLCVLGQLPQPFLAPLADGDDGVVYASTRIAESSQSISRQGPQRRDGLLTITAESSPLTRSTRQLVERLRTAKRSGDIEQIVSVCRQLGLEEEGNAESPVDRVQAELIVRHDRQGAPKSWQDDILASDPAWDSGHPSMVSASDGTLYLVAEDRAANYLDLYTSSDGGLTWNYWHSLNFSADPTKPSIAIGEGIKNRILVAFTYASGTPNAAVAVYWRDLDDSSYATVTVETNTALFIGNPQICVDSPEYTGWWPYLVFTDETLIKSSRGRYDCKFSRSLNQGETWSSPSTIELDVAFQAKPAIDFGDTNLYIAYAKEYAVGDRDVYLKKSNTLGSSWSSAFFLAYSSSDEWEPSVGATNGCGSVVTAYQRMHTPTNTDIESYYSLDGGNSWFWASIANTSGLETSVDLCVSQSYGMIHAAYLNWYDVYYKAADCFNPNIWGAAELVNEESKAVLLVKPTVTVNPTRIEEECIAWQDDRTDINHLIYFDTAEWDTATIDPGGGGDFATIQAAVDDAVGSVVIRLQDGAYTGPGNVDIDFLGKAIVLESISGNPLACWIDCGGSSGNPHRGFHFHSGEGPDSKVLNIAIANGYVDGSKDRSQGSGGAIRIESGSTPFLQGIVFEANAASDGGGGVHYEIASGGTLFACVFVGNQSVDGGGAVHCDGTSPEILVCSFVGNQSLNGGGGLHCENGSQPAVLSCTFALNSGPLGGGIHCETSSTVFLYFSIVSFSVSGMAAYCDGTSSVVAGCCDVYGNDGGDWTGCLQGQEGIDGNIALDPLFCDLFQINLSLAANSPCLPANNICGELIGAWDQGCGETGTFDPDLPPMIALHQNIPNPFNPATTIHFSLPAQQATKLVVYTIDGRRVVTLVDELLPAGQHNVVWTGRNDQGQPLPSGTYFYRLETDGSVLTRRMTLIR